MKNVLIFILVALLSITSVLAITSDVTFAPGNSYVIKDRNITVMSIDGDNDKVLVCVNNVKAIVSDVKTVNDVEIDIRSVVNDENAKLRLSYICNGNSCTCGSDCSNVKCFPQKAIESPDNNIPTVPSKTTTVKDVPEVTGNTVTEIKVLPSKTTPVKKSSSGSGGMFFVILLIITIALAVVAITNKRKKNSD